MKPTAIQVAEDLTFAFQSAGDAYAKDPNQAVYTLGSVVKILKKYGHPEPDFNGRALEATSDDADKAYKRKVGKAIEEARIAKGLTVAQLASLTGKTPSAVSYWESGKANLELATMRLIQRHLPVKLLNL